MLSFGANLDTDEYGPAEAFTNPEHGATEEETNEIWYKKYKIRWAVVILNIIIHIATLHVLVTFPYVEKYKTVLWAIFVYAFTFFGVGAGVHRLWTHRSYKAKWPLQVLLAICYTPSLQMPIRQWVQIHRVHHKYSDTDGDPHNVRKGLFYSHIGWVLVKRSQSIIDKYKSVEMKDINENHVISAFDRYFWTLAAILSIISVAIPVYCWHEEWYYAFMSQLARFVIAFECTLSVNSLAHIFGDKPFNKHINPADNRLVSYLTLGEGWHNYHHTFPYDYRTPELIGLRFDITAKMIEFFEKVGWAYDLRKPKDDLVKMVIKSKGDDLLQSLVN